MSAYRFHCSGPAGIVIDGQGQRIRSMLEMRAAAAAVARDVLAIYADTEPGAWLVTIQDETSRQVAVLRFDEAIGAACVPRGVLFPFPHGTEEAVVYRA
ncbi:MAG TPA: hypothetical protein VEA41_17850 [Salinarimonas sp.]|nr:hypothetical protein [Salinarimonas sp.]